MAQYYEDWSGATLNSKNKIAGWARRWYTELTGWTCVEDASGYAPAGRAVEAVVTSSGRAGLCFLAADGSPEQCEVAALMISNIPGSIAHIGGPFGRGSGVADATSAIVGSMMGHPGIRITQFVSAALTSQINTAYVWSAGVPYWNVVRMSGTEITQELRSADNPNIILSSHTWTASLVQSGWLGLFAFANGTIYRALCWCAGTGGDLAPIPGRTTSERQRSRLILTPW